jgi:hypothetical protein
VTIDLDDELEQLWDVLRLAATRDQRVTMTELTTTLSLEDADLLVRGVAAWEDAYELANPPPKGR